MPRESIANLDRWSALMGLWGFNANEKTFESLVEMYGENGRHYHNLEHVGACLRHLDKFIDQLAHHREVELALWFHDVIYKPLAVGNERKSAEWVASFLAHNGATDEEAARVYRLIMATEHTAPSQSKDESILVDVDLSILGANPDEYDAFERNVREEFKMVPVSIYRQKRTEVLRGFLERQQIYQNSPFSGERERQARENLAEAIFRLAEGKSI